MNRPSPWWLRWLRPPERKVPQHARLADGRAPSSEPDLPRTNVRAAAAAVPDTRSGFLDTDFAWAYRLEDQEAVPAKRADTAEPVR